MALNRERFHHLLPKEALEGKEALIVGVGGIGGYLAVLLAKMGLEKVTLVDFDEVEDVNVATQVHDERFLGWMKVEATREQIFNVNLECVVTMIADKFEDVMLLDEYAVVVAALDSLPVRKQVVEAWMVTHHQGEGSLLVDPRMALEACEVNLFRGDAGLSKEFERYHAALSDRVTAELPCGAKAVAYTGSFAANLCAAQIRRFLVGHDVPYYIAADVGCGRMESDWLEGQGYETDLADVGGEEGDALARTA